MITYSLKTVEVKNSLKRLIAKTPQLSRRILSFICEAVVAQSVTQHLSGQTLKRQTGTLAKSLTYKLQDDFNAKVGTNVRYAAIHEFGGVILPKEAKALVFKIKDVWITTQKVVMPARPYLAPAINYVMLYQAPEIMKRQANEWLGREWYK